LISPLTCGRTSATNDGLVRPGSSRVNVTDSGRSVTTVTTALLAGGAGGASRLQAVKSINSDRTTKAMRRGLGFIKSSNRI